LVILLFVTSRPVSIACDDQGRQVVPGQPPSRPSGLLVVVERAGADFITQFRTKFTDNTKKTKCKFMNIIFFVPLRLLMVFITLKIIFIFRLKLLA
jgi:hypothetical protein